VKAFGVELPPRGHVVPVRGKVATVTFSRDGKMLAAGAVHPLPDSPPVRGAMIWDTATGKELHRLWPKLPIFCLGFSNDGALLMGSSDLSLIYFPAKDEQETCWHDSGEVRSLSFTHDGKIVAIGISGGETPGRIKRWIGGNGELGPVLGKESGSPVQQILYSPHDNTLAVAYRNGQVYLYPPNKPLEPISVQPERPGSPPALAFAPDRRILAVGHSRELRWWNLPEGVREDQTVVEEDEITALAYTPDGKYLVLASRNPDVVLRRVSTGQKVYTFQGHREGVDTIAIHPDGEILATGSRDGDVRIWNLRAAVANAEK
jgi:WD40 repeat protein